MVARVLSSSRPMLYINIETFIWLLPRIIFCFRILQDAKNWQLTLQSSIAIFLLNPKGLKQLFYVTRIHSNVFLPRFLEITRWLFWNLFLNVTDKAKRFNFSAFIKFRYRCNKVINVHNIASSRYFSICFVNSLFFFPLPPIYQGHAIWKFIESGNLN